MSCSFHFRSNKEMKPWGRYWGLTIVIPSAPNLYNYSILYRVLRGMYNHLLRHRFFANCLCRLTWCKRLLYRLLLSFVLSRNFWLTDKRIFFSVTESVDISWSRHGLLEERITNALSDLTGEAVQIGGSEDLLHLLLYRESVVPS